MAEAATEFGKIKDAVHHVAQDMDATSSSAKHASDALGTVLKTLLVVDITLKGLERASAFSPMARNLKEAFTTLGKSADQLKGIHYAELELADKRFRANEITKEQVKEIADRTQIRYPILQAQLRLEEEMRRVGALRLIILGGILTQTIATYRANSRLNDDLIKANVGWGARYDLVQENYAVQRQLGVSFGTIIEAQRTLIQYGMQNNRAYGETLKTVVELHEGLGMSVQAATELAVIAERQIKTSFKDTADVVAQLVDETSLTADEVERIAKTLGPLILAIQPRGAPAFPQIAQALGQYEDAVKRLGGMGDEFTQMIGKMLTPEGLLQAGILGIHDPGQLLKATGIQQAMEAFNRYADQMLAGSAEGSYDRMMRMQALADYFGTTIGQMGLMVEAVKNVNTQVDERITLEQRFRMQMAEAGKSFGQIYNSLTTLIQKALSPLAYLINAVAYGINWLIQQILNHKAVTVAAAVAVYGGIVLLVAQLWSAFKAFFQVAAAAGIAAMQLREYAAAQTAQALVSGGAGVAGIGKAAAKGAEQAGIFKTLMMVFRNKATWGTLGETIGLRIGAVIMRLASIFTESIAALGTLISFLATPVGWVVLALVAIGITLWKIHNIHKETADMLKRQAVRDVQLGEKIVDQGKRNVYLAARTGDYARVRREEISAMNWMGPPYTGKSPLEIARMKEALSREYEAEVKVATATARDFGKLIKTPVEREQDVMEANRLQQEIARGTQTQKDIAKKEQEAEERRERERLQQMELMYLRDGGVVGRQFPGQGSYY